MAAVGQEFWVVATKVENTGGSTQTLKDKCLADLKGNSALVSKVSTGGQDGPWKFDVPDGDRALIFGSFDNLIRLTDDLAKFDSQVDGVLHRLERQYIELDPKAEFKVSSQRQKKEVTDYLRAWVWDEAKFPKSRSITDNLMLLMASVNRLDEEARTKTAQYNDFKTQRGNLSKKDGANLTNRELIDVFTPDVVKNNGKADDDFVVTEYLTTIPVILTRGAEKDFLQTYEKMCDNVIPGSARRFESLDDKDGNTIWRVVLFKSASEAFKKACREKRYIVRDFEYSEENYKKVKEHRDHLDEQVKRQHELVKNLYQAAWSDTMVALMHIKAMRVFVESTLRFGMPPSFATFILTPKASAPARKALAAILGQSSEVGSAKLADAAQDEGDEVYPYVSFSFTPFTVPRDK